MRSELETKTDQELFDEMQRRKLINVMRVEVNVSMEEKRLHTLHSRLGDLDLTVTDRGYEQIARHLFAEGVVEKDGPHKSGTVEKYYFSLAVVKLPEIES